MANDIKTRSIQNVSTAYVEFTYADFDTGVANPVVPVPPGAIVTDIQCVITTAFDSGTSDVIDIGDGADPDRYTATQIDAQTAANYNIVEGTSPCIPTGYQYTEADTIDMTVTLTGTAATAGAGFIVVSYIVDGRASEVMV